MICTGQRSKASCAHASRSSGKVPSAMLPSIRYFSMIRLNESSGSCSNNPGQVSQHEPQLTHVARSKINFTSVLPTMVHSKCNTIKLPVVPISWHFVTRLNLKCKFFFGGGWITILAIIKKPLLDCPQVCSQGSTKALTSSRGIILHRVF